MNIILFCVLSLSLSFAQDFGYDENVTTTSKQINPDGFSLDGADAGSSASSSGGGGGASSGGGSASSSAANAGTSFLDSGEDSDQILGNSQINAVSESSSLTYEAKSSPVLTAVGQDQASATAAQQKDALKEAAKAPVPSSNDVAATEKVADLAVMTSPAKVDQVFNIGTTTSSSGSTNKKDFAQDDLNTINDIRVALFTTSDPKADVDITIPSLYKYHQWSTMKEESAILARGFMDPLGSKKIGSSLYAMYSTLDETVPRMGAYNVGFFDNLTWNLGVNSDPIMLPNNVLVSQILRSLLFPVIMPNNDLTDYKYTTPSDNLKNNNSQLSFHAKQVVEALGPEIGSMQTITQAYIYTKALNMQLKSCAVNYAPATTATTAVAGVDVNAIMSQVSSLGSGTEVGYVLVPAKNSFSSFDKNGIKGESVYCNANICTSGKGQGCPPQGANFDYMGNGFSGILNVLSLLNQLLAVNPYNDVAVAEKASIYILNNQSYKDADLPDVLNCMSSVSLFGEKGVIRCQDANIAAIDFLNAYNQEKVRQSNMGRDLNSQGIVGNSEGLGFVNKMKEKSALVLSKLEDIMPLMLSSDIYNSSSQYFLSQALPSYNITRLSAHDLVEFKRLYDVAPKDKSEKIANNNNKLLSWVDQFSQAFTKNYPSFKNDDLKKLINLNDPNMTNSSFLFSQKSSNNDLLISMSAKAYLDSFLNVAMSTPFVSGMPLPQNNIHGTRHEQWISLAGSFYLLLSDDTTDGWYATKSLTSNSNSYRIIVRSKNMGEDIWSKRKQYLSKLGRAIAEQESILRHDASVQDEARSHIKQFYFDRSVKYDFDIKDEKGQNVSKQSYTPMQIMSQVHTWRLDPVYAWRSGLSVMNQEDLTREMLYMMSEQQALLFKLLLAFEDMKMMQAVRFYNESASGANTFGMGPMADIQNNIDNYVAGSTVAMSFKNMQDSYKDSQDRIAATTQSMSSMDVGKILSSVMPGATSDSDSGVQASSMLANTMASQP